MDGVEAMLKIRENNTGDYVNIVALTANAISGIESKYKNAGFDGYLAKPIEPRDMEEILLKMLPERLLKGKGESLDDQEENPAFDDDLEILEFGPQNDDPVKDDTASDKLESLKDIGINVEQGLHYAMCDSGLYLDLVRDFAVGWTDKKKALNGYISENDLKDYKILIHSLKSALRTIGVDEMSELAANLEKASLNGEKEYLDEFHNTFIDDCDKLTEQISRI